MASPPSTGRLAAKVLYRPPPSHASLPRLPPSPPSPPPSLVSPSSPPALPSPPYLASLASRPRLLFVLVVLNGRTGSTILWGKTMDSGH